MAVHGANLHRTLEPLANKVLTPVGCWGGAQKMQKNSKFVMQKAKKTQKKI